MRRENWEKLGNVDACIALASAVSLMCGLLPALDPSPSKTEQIILSVRLGIAVGTAVGGIRCGALKFRRAAWVALLLLLPWVIGILDYAVKGGGAFAREYWTNPIYW